MPPLNKPISPVTNGTSPRPLPINPEARAKPDVPPPEEVRLEVAGGKGLPMMGMLVSEPLIPTRSSLFD
ncbi:MAG TPA: hypothetical protein VG096_26510 [Bryobacteraceae bacterium]|nr:hypothetical protein [Bryobacteraceae bacterium]